MTTIVLPRHSFRNNAKGKRGNDTQTCVWLVWWASQGELRTGDHHTVITPSDLLEYGEVVYWSGKRSDPQVQALALN